MYTQNVDMLEFEVGLEEGDVVECHGSFRRSHCTRCSFALHTAEEMEEKFWSFVRKSQVPCCPLCKALLRPSVTFFGEALPDRFLMANSDLPSCDLLLVIGTSLLVYPVAALPQSVHGKAVRVLLNKESSGCFQFVPASSDSNAEQEQNFRHETSIYRDVFIQGNCDDAAEIFAQIVDFNDEFKDGKM